MIVQNAAVLLCLTLMVGGAGGFLADLAGLSGGWLIGSVVAVFAISAFKVPASLPGWLRSIAMGFAGMMIGASVDQDTLQIGSVLPLSLAVMAVFLTITVWLTYNLHRWWWQASPATALACAWPGAVLVVLASGETTNADMRRVSVVQFVRILALMGILPVTIGLYQDQATNPPIFFSPDLGIAIVLTFVSIAIANWKGLFGGEMYLAAFIIGGLSGFGILDLGIPAQAANVFQILIGVFIGIELARCGLKAFVSVLTPSIVSAIMAAFMTILVAYALTWVLDYPIAALALAMAPGGAEAMVLLTKVFDVDPAFVGIHHTIRVIVLTLSYPFIARWIVRPDYQATDKP